MRKACFNDQISDKIVRCRLCPNFCIIKAGEQSPCLSRTNIDGELYATSYAKTCSLSIDPIEKKPLYHFFPNTEILSIGSNSCNLHCKFCQNFSISQQRAETVDISASKLLEICNDKGIKSIAFTYSEPLTWYEFIIDTAPKLKEAGIKTVLVSNGFINQPPLLKLLPFIDAMNIDLKSFSSEFYRNICGGRLQPVLETLKTVYNHTHLEITYLLIPDLNDNLEEFDEMIEFIMAIDRSIPLHISAYYPAYKLTNRNTTAEEILRFKDRALKKLDFVYAGNIGYGADTICPGCGEVLIRRKGFTTRVLNLASGNCRNCNYRLYGSLDA